MCGAKENGEKKMATRNPGDEVYLRSCLMDKAREGLLVVDGIYKKNYSWQRFMKQVYFYL